MTTEPPKPEGHAISSMTEEEISKFTMEYLDHKWIPIDKQSAQHHPWMNVVLVLAYDTIMDCGKKTPGGNIVGWYNTQEMSVRMMLPDDDHEIRRRINKAMAAMREAANNK